MTEKLTPFTNIPQPADQGEGEEQFFLNKTKELQVGTGSKSFRVDRRGMWLGGDDPASAGFAVDMDGNISGSSLTLSALSGDLDDIPDGSTYKKAVQNQLTGGDRAYSGLNSSSEIIKGFLSRDLGIKSKPVGYDGVIISSEGLYGYENGSANFYISSAGDAYFSGDIVSSTMTASTITGGTVRTSSGSTRVELNGSNNALDVYKSGVLRASLSEDRLYLRAPDANYGGAIYAPTSGEIEILSTAKITLNSGFASVSHESFLSSSVFFSNDESPTDLGKSTKRWNKLYIDSIDLNGTTRTSWPSSIGYPGAGIALSTGSSWGTSITNNSGNWNTAYGWGNHASAGYLLKSGGTMTGNITMPGSGYYIDFNDSYIDRVNTVYFQTRTSDPGAAAGAVYYNTLSGTLRVYTGSTWRDVAFV